MQRAEPHETPQLPQCASSLSMSKHAPRQTTRPPVHRCTHCPASQKRPKSHSRPHAPQCPVSEASATHAPSQSVNPSPQTDDGPPSTVPPSTEAPTSTDGPASFGAGDIAPSPLHAAVDPTRRARRTRRTSRRDVLRFCMERRCLEARLGRAHRRNEAAKVRTVAKPKPQADRRRGLAAMDQIDIDSHKPNIRICTPEAEGEQEF